MTWPQFYKDRVGSHQYLLYFVDKYTPFIDKISELVEDYMFGIGEFGCGIATTSKALQYIGLPHTHYCYDICPTMLYLARENVFPDFYFGNCETRKCLFHLHDISKKMPPRRYDLIHSHGVLEHFSDVEIQSIIYHQLNMSDNIVHYVPGEYDEPSFGDERLMSASQWREILKDYPVEVSQFNENDLMITSKP